LSHARDRAAPVHLRLLAQVIAFSSSWSPPFPICSTAISRAAPPPTARRSELGILLDPIADKLLLVLATLVPIFWMTRHPIILARDKVDYAIPCGGSLPLWVACCSSA